MNSNWHIARNHKLHFCVTRMGDKGAEFLNSASGRASSFKTIAGAKRALKYLQAAAAAAAK